MFIVNSGLAQDEEPLPPPPPPSAARHQQMLERFDTDKDGVLSAEEHAVARETLQAEGVRPPGRPQGGKGRPGGPGDGSGLNHEQMMKAADTDGDGVVSDEERAAMRAKMQARGKMNRQQMLERFDTDGDGQISPEERQAARESMGGRGPGQGKAGGPNHAEMMKRMDKDGDGVISDEERAAAHAARQGAGKKGPPPPPPPPEQE
ncbi:MAG: EF-hand domain-containing protein [Opitutaceae bacterium]